MIDRVTCGGCGKVMVPLNKATNGDSVQYNYECECDNTYFITITQCTRAHPVRAEYGEKCCAQSDDEDYHEEKCCAPEQMDIVERIHIMKLNAEELELERKILDLEEGLHHARERARIR